MYFFLGLFLLILIITLLIFASKILFWILAFADFAIVGGSVAFLIHYFLGWHTVFIILSAIAAMGIYFGIIQIPIVKYIIPLAVHGFIAWTIIIEIVNVERAEPLDTVWTWTWIIIITLVLFGSRLWAINKLELNYNESRKEKNNIGDSVSGGTQSPYHSHATVSQQSEPSDEELIKYAKYIIEQEKLKGNSENTQVENAKSSTATESDQAAQNGTIEASENTHLTQHTENSVATSNQEADSDTKD